ncbi:hypothetical protein, partial [Salmonella sp. SAL4457]|uniref:hypothetical protein n=1 Tax=Salmonella sp. SAL4457 TaxID=3159912 RepID=UPI00397C20D9
MNDLDRMRQREGAAIATDLRARLAAVRVTADKIAQRGPELSDGMAKKFRERLVRVAATVAAPSEGALATREVV